MICPWKFKGCWYVLESLKGVDLLESLPTSPIFVFLLWNWHFWRICRLLCSSIFFCIDFNFLATQYVLDVSQAWKISNLWSIGKLVNCPNNQRQKLSTKPQNPPLYWHWENLEKRLFVFHQKDTYILYYITEYNILLKLTETRSFHNIFNWLRERSDGDFVLKYSIICLHV